MAKEPAPDFQVLVPYKQLEQLLKASGEVAQLRKEISRLESQILALRLIQSETIEAIGEIKKQL